MARRYSPTKKLEEHNPAVEHMYVKFPGKELLDVTLTSTESSAELDEQKLFTLLRQHEIREEGKVHRLPHYTHLHNHPRRKDDIHGDALPSKQDVDNFLKTSLIKTMIIAQQDAESAEVQGYFFLRKESKSSSREAITRARMLEYSAVARHSPLKAIKRLADDYSLQYKWVPAPGYTLPKNVHALQSSKWAFIKKEVPLEQQVMSACAIIGLLGSLIVSSVMITGSAITSPDPVSLSPLNVILFLIGIGGAYLYFKHRR